MLPKSIPAVLLGMALVALGPNPAVRAAENDAAADLPLSDVVLFNSGVGYFQRDGAVEGDARLELQFDAEDINDLLKSMVLQDFDGGRITSVNYTSRDPIAKTLKSFAVDLTEDPSLAELLGQVRGERVELAAPNPLQGVIVGIEKQQVPIGEKGTVKVDVLNLLTDEGLQSVALNQVQQIRFAREELDDELRQALAVLATSHDMQKKGVALSFTGEGRRRVRVGYIAEAPVWKTSYRLVLSEDEAPFLQGWAIVENTSDEDWQDVRLTLVSGRPISFLMDLYQPLYVPRPLVELEGYASLRPQKYAEAMEELERAADRPAPAAARAARASSGPRSPKSADRVRKAESRLPMLGVEDAHLAFDKLALNTGVQSLAQAADVGELFRYTIDTPVTLPRQQSALLPIVNQSVEGQKVSIYNAAVHAKHPLNGLRLKNTTGLHLMQGPITVFEGGVYAGDAQIDHLQPDGERLISYSMDLDCEVERLARSRPEELLAVRIAKGTLIATRKFHKEQTYNAKNRGDKNRRLLVEHPFDPDWKLIAPEEPNERTRDVYRFAVPLAAGEAEKLVVAQERQIDERIVLAGAPDEQLDEIAFYLRARVVSAAVKDALSKLMTMKRDLGATIAQRERLEKEIGEIHQEQKRIRENMTRLERNSPLYARYVKILTDQEDKLAELRDKVDSLRDQQTQQQKALDDYLASLDVA